MAKIIRSFVFLATECPLPTDLGEYCCHIKGNLCHEKQVGSLQRQVAFFGVPRPFTLCQDLSKTHRTSQGLNHAL